MILRKLVASDVIPFKHGFEPSPLDCNWAWVAIENEQIVGLLLAAPCHGNVFLVRLKCENAPKHALRALIRYVFRDLHADGYRAAFTYFDLENGTEARVLKMMMAGCKERGGAIASRHAICVTAVEDWCNI